MSVQFNVPTPVQGDSITSLQTDNTPPSPEEAKLINTLFQKQLTTMERAMLGIKDVIAVSLLFALLSTPQADVLIKKFFPSAENAYYRLGVKTCLFAIAYFLMKNLYLAKKQ